MPNNVLGQSKKLAYLLRHDRQSLFLPGGWRRIQEVSDNLKLSVELIAEIVSNDEKGRYEIDSNNGLIRALYGHSVDVDLRLNSQVHPPILFHGTAEKYIDSIKAQGILPQSRVYVHLTEDIDLAMKTGSRHGNPIILKVSTEPLLKAACLFYRTNNGIWLTKRVPAEYFEIYNP